MKNTNRAAAAAVLLGALALSAPHALADNPAPKPAPKAAPKPAPELCPGISFGYHETIESQGFLGLLTPKADAYTPRQALKELFDASRAQAQYDVHGRDAMILRHYWPKLCEYLKTKKVKTVWLACKADTEEEEGRFFGSLGKSKDGGEVRFVGSMTATCVISKYNKSNNPSWSDLTDAALTRPIGDVMTIYPSLEESMGDRYDVIRNRDRRRELYLRLLGNMIELVEEDFWKVGMSTPPRGESEPGRECRPAVARLEAPFGDLRAPAERAAEKPL